MPTAETGLESVLACPRCKGGVSEEGDGFRCGRCGRVGTRSLGIPDFVAARGTLDLAGGGRFDLSRDTDMAGRVAQDAQRLSYDELRRHVSREADEQEARALPRHALRAHRRFARLYARMETDVGMAAGEGILTKANTFLAGRGEPPIAAGWVLEGGAGTGLHLPGFAPYFGRLVLVDASLTFLVLARKLAEELGAGTVDFVRADLCALPFARETFDFVHESGVIEHVADPDEMVAEALRVRSPGGTYLCLSPNRYPITPEPHFRLPLFGLFPKPLRTALLPLVRGMTSEAGTDLLSLRRLRACFERAGEPGVPIYFLPPGLERTVRQTRVRRLVRSALAHPFGRRLADLLLNRALLGVMPYHVALARRGAT